jgi:hypothetical protein
VVYAVYGPGGKLTKLEVISKAEAARRWGVSKAAVTKYVAKGMPVREDGRLDWPAVDHFRRSYNVPERSGNFASRAAESEPGTGAQSTPGPVPVPAIPIPSEDNGRADEGTRAEASRQLEWQRVRSLQLKVDREEGRLVALDQVNAFVAGMILKARDELTRIPLEVRDVLAQETDPIRCGQLIETKIQAALVKLSEYRIAA